MEACGGPDADCADETESVEPSIASSRTSEAGDDDTYTRFRDPPLGCVRLRPSAWRSIPATVFFEYPPELGLKRNDISITEPLGVRKLIYSSHWERVCIRHAFQRAGFENNPGRKDWTGLWSKHQNDTQMKGLNCLQKVNHFPSSWCIGRKDRLARTMQTMQRLYGGEFDFHPENFILPTERDALFRQVVNDQQLCKSRSCAGSGNRRIEIEKASMWIIKPVASSCGRGIKVITGQQVLSLPKTKRALVQRYLHSPYLIDGKKFDLRIYVLVSGVDPLRIYIHNEGLTRISTSSYNLKNLSNRFAHLTNYSINKKSKVFKAATFEGVGDYHETGAPAGEGGSDTEGFKWSLAAFKRWLSKRESPEVMLATFERIHSLCVKTMIAAESTITPQMHSTANFRSNCFELFGCDVILDSDLNPHLLEVNVSPSLVGSSPLDKRIKGTVIADILHIVGLYPHDPKLLKKYGDVVRQTGSVCFSENQNPFAFGSLSKMMSSQDVWRRSPSPLSVDMTALCNSDTAWLLLLSCDDEFSRAESTQFQRAHPASDTVLHFCSLYRNSRFSDHILGRWVFEHGSAGPLRNLIPARYIRKSTEVCTSLSYPIESDTAPTPTFPAKITPPLPPKYLGKPLSLDCDRNTGGGGIGVGVGRGGGSTLGVGPGLERPIVLSSRKPVPLVGVAAPSKAPEKLTHDLIPMETSRQQSIHMGPISNTAMTDPKTGSENFQVASRLPSSSASSSSSNKHQHVSSPRDSRDSPRFRRHSSCNTSDLSPSMRVNSTEANDFSEVEKIPLAATVSDIRLLRNISRGLIYNPPDLEKVGMSRHCFQKEIVATQMGTRRNVIRCHAAEPREARVSKCSSAMLHRQLLHRESTVCQDQKQCAIAFDFVGATEPAFLKNTNADAHQPFP